MALLNPSDFREIVSGRDRGFKAAAWRALFAAIEPLYAAAVRYRNWRYDTGRSAIARVEVPVISVGNLTLGGTGKTPMVEWLARWFLDRGIRVVLVSRGYGAVEGQTNDEAKELQDKLPEVPHLQNPERRVAAREAIDRLGAQLILLDDGFQHRRLARDLDIVLVDALDPFGCGHVFPRGMLREPLTGFARAQVIALSRADAVDAQARQRIRDRIRQYNPSAVWLELSHAPRALRSAGGTQVPLEKLAQQRLLAFCGIGNPAGFRHALESCGYTLVAFREFPDHHQYGSADREELASLAQASGAESLVCTHKDLVKIPQAAIDARPIWALEIGLQVLGGADDLQSRLEVLAAQAHASVGKPPAEL